MNILEEIQNCPVEWKELGEVCDTVTDFTAAGSFASNAKNVKYIQEASFAQLIRTTDLKSGFRGNNFVYVDEHAFNYLYRVNLNQESLVMPNVGNCGEIYYIKPEDLQYKNNVLGPNALLVRSSKEINRYLFHLFQSGQFQNELAKITSNTGQTKYNKTNLKKIKIPIPPIEIQEKIVQILDKMTEYVTELTSELTSRKKQYSFYRDKLLSFEDEVYQVKWKTLLDISKKITSGGTPNRSNSLYYGGSIPWLRTQEVDFREIYDTELRITEEGLANSSAKWIEKNAVIVAMYGATAAKVGIAKIPLTTNQACCNIEVEEDIANYRYVYHWLTYNYEVLKSMGQGSQSNINAGMIKSFKIPVPSLEIQSRIVQILDNFDMVCNDLNIGLPKEIELRQKQYEYFKEKLLTFVAEGDYTESRVE